MSGTKDGGRRAAQTNKEKQGEDFYKRIGAMGGKTSHPETRAFSNKALARKAGAMGGKISRRTKKEEL